MVRLAGGWLCRWRVRVGGVRGRCGILRRVVAFFQKTGVLLGGIFWDLMYL